ncbi:hypothetical protein MRB53_022018 [Persea americana]|uniref:Uncharacterized protein n=1 Tax=Persea americana TaxID=3435 RepID=A0ACC2L5J8_PERAE|nr:hypothetical protein MRB53_022018 [Persea americana]
MEEKKRAPVLFYFNQRWGVNEGEFSTAPMPQQKGEGRRAKTRRAGRRDGLAVEIDCKCLETQGASAGSSDGAAATTMPGLRLPTKGVGRKVWDSICGVCASRTGREKAFWALTQGKYYARVVKEEDGVGEGGVLRETGVLKHLTVENEFEHVGVGLVPVVRPIESPGAQAMVCDVRAKIAVDEVVRAMGQ